MANVRSFLESTGLDLDMLLDRRHKLLSGLDISTQRGAEIGALCRPLVRRSEGNIIYIDYADTAALRLKYANDPNVNVEDIVEVDAIWGEGAIQDALGAGEKVDYILASHVIEHVPDLITAIVPNLTD